VGYLPEHNPLYLEMYVREYLDFTASIFGLKSVSKRVKEMIGLTGLLEEKHKKIGQLSKGYRQRVGLAQAMLHDPKVLILDEPTSGLDPNQIMEIRNLIVDLGREKTVLLSTHIMQEVEAICNRVIIINKGKIVADDNTGDLRKNMQFQTRVSVSFNGTIDIGVLDAIPGVTSVRLTSGSNYELYCDTKENIQELVFKTAVANQWVITELKQFENSMEDVFKSLTGNN
jgi:ABC-2 type transport system ATP-binding protein